MNKEQIDKALDDNLRDGLLEEIIQNGKRSYRMTHKGIIHTEDILRKEIGIDPDAITAQAELKDWIRKNLM